MNLDAVKKNVRVALNEDSVRQDLSIKAITPDAIPHRSPLHPSPSNRQASTSPKTNPVFISAPLTNEQRRCIHAVCSMVQNIPSFYLKIFVLFELSLLKH